MKSKIKEILYISIFLIIFTIFLVSLPSFIFKNNNELDTDKVLLTTKSSDLLEQKRYEVIAFSLTNVLDNISVQNSYYKTIQHLLVTNQISNREHSLGQEILSLHLKNKTQHVKSVTQEIVDYILDQYDTQEQRKWRNHELLLLKNNNVISTLYNSSHLLLSFENATIKAETSFYLSVFSNQLYIFEFKNKTKEEVLIEINENRSNFIQLEKFFDKETQMPRRDIINFNSSFIKSDDIYEIKFRIWK